MYQAESRFAPAKAGEKVLLVRQAEDAKTSIFRVNSKI
jgi:hypothetical protein